MREYFVSLMEGAIAADRALSDAERGSAFVERSVEGGGASFTLTDLCHVLLAIGDDELDAFRFFAGGVEYLRTDPSLPPDTNALEMARAQIGYLLPYLSTDQAAMWVRLTACRHPLVGASRTTPALLDELGLSDPVTERKPLV
jgi:hypothetical protein